MQRATLQAISRRAFDEVWSGDNPAAIDELFAPDYVFHDAGSLELVGLNQFKQLLAMYRATFANLRFVVKEVLVDGRPASRRASRRRASFRRCTMGPSPRITMFRRPASPSTACSTARSWRPGRTGTPWAYFSRSARSRRKRLRRRRFGFVATVESPPVLRWLRTDSRQFSGTDHSSSVSPGTFWKSRTLRVRRGISLASAIEAISAISCVPMRNFSAVSS